MISFLDKEFQGQKGPILYSAESVPLGIAEAGTQVVWFWILFYPYYIKHLPRWKSSRGREDMKLEAEGLFPFISASFLFGLPMDTFRWE